MYLQYILQYYFEILTPISFSNTHMTHLDKISAWEGQLRTKFRRVY